MANEEVRVQGPAAPGLVAERPPGPVLGAVSAAASIAGLLIVIYGDVGALYAVPHR